MNETGIRFSGVSKLLENPYRRFFMQTIGCSTRSFNVM